LSNRCSTVKGGGGSAIGLRARPGLLGGALLLDGLLRFLLLVAARSASVLGLGHGLRPPLDPIEGTAPPRRARPAAARWRGGTPGYAPSRRWGRARRRRRSVRASRPTRR